ncbi:uncharacterized protein PHALS_06167 [Plasmopara halstedii]|uniref:Uncharacterized protein n=1 Tax=Plasmopara halstedii TaxID=4781 RepID=A0A0P1B2R7_PLAHL|nr:uncharacterized protein PHALS_06167 [Plasmopara halstedii]CEG48341.1 hypothetical protein PHALS_06167 [Plasmopara halstedii]|eukprot:XP_024584710.1 hypothetical protein PHALS_06167 [Plasmopara halstedii]
MNVKVEIAVRVLSTCYAVGIGGMILSLQGEDTSYIMLQVVFTMVFTCPCLWAIIRFCRDHATRRKMVVLPEKKAKKKPDIAKTSVKVVQRTQAEILAEQRERVRNLQNVSEKPKVKIPKRKGPPSAKMTLNK